MSFQSVLKKIIYISITNSKILAVSMKMFICQRTLKVSKLLVELFSLIAASEFEQLYFWMKGIHFCCQESGFWLIELDTNVPQYFVCHAQNLKRSMVSGRGWQKTYHFSALFHLTWVTNEMVVFKKLYRACNVPTPNNHSHWRFFWK